MIENLTIDIQEPKEFAALPLLNDVHPSDMLQCLNK